MKLKKPKTRKTFLPFTCPTIGKEEIKEVTDTLKSGWLATGPKTELFKEHFKKFAGAKHCIALNSATAGLHLTYLAAGIKPENNIITSPLTFAATANAIIHAGAKVKFADIDIDTLNISPAQIEKNVNSRTKIIVPVHFAGLPCDMDKIFKIARKNKCLVIEDAAHAVGSQYKGKKIGSISDMSVFSFHPNKNITTGEGGIITFNNEAYKKKLEILSFHGINKHSYKKYKNRPPYDFDVEEAGFKYNMTDIQAAIGLHQLKKINKFNAKRTAIAKKYLNGFKNIEELKLPVAPKYKHKHSWHMFTPLIKTEKLKINRFEFAEELKKLNIGTGYHYRALHLHPFYQKLGFKKGQFPNAEYVSSRIITLPLFPTMTDKDVKDVIDAVKYIIAKNLKTG